MLAQPSGAPPAHDARLPATLRGAFAVAAVAVVGWCLWNALGWYGHPTPGVLIDAGGVVSNYGSLPGASGRGKLRFPDQVLRVDGRPLVRQGSSPPARVWDEAITAADRAGRDTITATIRTEEGVVDRKLEIRAFGAKAWWTYVGSLLLAGMLFIAAGGTALALGRGSALAAAFAKVGLSTGFLCLTVFDFHTTRQLVWAFFLAFSLMPVRWSMLALRFPDDAPLLQRHPWLDRAADAVGGAVGVAFIVLYASGAETSALQQAWTLVMGGAFLLFCTVFVVRFMLSKGLRRLRMRAFLVSVVPPLLVTVGAVATPQTLGRWLGDWAESVSYGALSLFPLSTAYALVRYDLWGSRALLSRPLMRGGVVALVASLAAAGGTAAAVELGIPFRDAMVAAIAATSLSTFGVIAALWAVDRYVFAARARYKPTVEQLSEELIAIASPDDVARALERTIARWLPCDTVRITLDDAPEPGEPGDRRSSSPRIRHRSEESAALDLDLSFGGARLGHLLVEKRDEALFTEDDVDLLQTIVNQGALALAHASAYQELEMRRREQAAAWRGERAALVETVAAEIAHEIRYPINFFRSFFQTDPGPVDEEDLDIGREEVERLERLVSGLRRMAQGTLTRAPVRLAHVCDRVETLLGDALGERQLECEDVEGVRLSADVDQLTQILVNLVSNGLQAATSEGRVGVRWQGRPEGGCLVVWDDGPGFEGEWSDLFAPWYTTKQKGTGLGLAITHRLVRAHGWSITALRSGDRTEFVVSVSEESIIDREAPPGKVPSESPRPREDTRRRRSA